MNHRTTSRLTTLTKGLLLALLLSQTATSSALSLRSYGTFGTIVAAIIGIAAVRLETKNPEPAPPTLDNNANLLQRILHYIDHTIIGQKRKTTWRKGENDNPQLVKCRPCGFGSYYELFKFTATGLAIFQTIDKAEASGINWLQNVGLYELFCSECEGVS